MVSKGMTTNAPSASMTRLRASSASFRRWASVWSSGACFGNSSVLVDPSMKWMTMPRFSPLFSLMRRLEQVPCRGGIGPRSYRRRRRRRLGWDMRALTPVLVGAALLALGLPAHASFLSGEALDKAADVLAVLIIIFVPVVAVVVFWLVHILPEKFAHKRHHPQRDAIQVLCLLSLVFGGLLWPLAWLWAFTKPIAYRAAYGTDKHEDYYGEMAEKQQAGALTDDEQRHLLEDLAAIEAKGALPASLRGLQERLSSEAGKRRGDDTKRAAA